MFLLLGYVSIALVQWYRQYCRCSRYSQVMLRALRTGSVLVQRGKSAKHGSVGALLNSPLLSCSRSYKETQLLSEDALAISVVNPRQRVDLVDWTSYLELHPSQDVNNSVIVLLEAGRPDNLDTFVQAAVQVPLAQQVHVLQHGCPIAWKSGTPFGIILHCTYRNFVLLCDAFGQGRLTLDEDLELYRLLTVSATGRPQSLKRRGDQSRQSSLQQENDAAKSSSCGSSLMGGVVVEDQARKENYVDIEGSPRVKIPVSSGLSVERGACREIGGDMIRAKRKMSPLTVDCSDGGEMLNNCDNGYNGVLQTGNKVPQTTNTDSCLLDGDLSGMGHSECHPQQEVNTKVSGKVEGSVQQPLASGDNELRHAIGIPDGESSCLKTVTADLSTNATNNTDVSRSAEAESPDDIAANDNLTQKIERPKVSKPPNVLVYCGIKDSARKFGNIKSCLEQCLNSDAYIIYHLAHEQVATIPWADNSAALIVSCDKLYADIERKFSDYLLSGGKVISFGSSLETKFLEREEVQKRHAITKFSFDKWKDVSSVHGCHRYKPGSLKRGNSSMDALVVDRKSGDPLVVLLTLSAPSCNGCAIFSQLFLERDPAELAVDSQTFSQLKQSNSDRLGVMQHLFSLLNLDTSTAPAHHLTPCYMLARSQALKTNLLDTVASRMKKGVIKSRSLSLQFVQDASAAPSATPDLLPVVIQTEVLTKGDAASTEHIQYFEPEVYWQHLSTSVLGQVVFYTDVIPTTMTVFEGLQFSIPEKVGVIAVAGRQTSGKGRGGNAWLSPVGCAMFTLPLSVPVDSKLGQRITFLQHIVGLAVVHSIRSLPGYQDLELRLKWPNDIYYRDQMKLGGVLVTSTIMGDRVHATVGCGVNVANSHPTICINDIIQHHNMETGSNLSRLSASQVVAMTVSALERLISQFQAEGSQTFCDLYYKYWLHGGVSVQLESEGEEVEICGLDGFGFLQVKTKKGKQLSVQPDGNSFDMMRNLIALKKQ
ncbi:hypothetical protein BaRGS_00014203 [Batillaria attramentaria]|uniref:BPL/LPL catalytic domain-containing protein n=1 Tax=Batillaria attramentaria TaxID=370345 RepID=A0ABD0L5D4_9CAEN